MIGSHPSLIGTFRGPIQQTCLAYKYQVHHVPSLVSNFKYFKTMFCLNIYFSFLFVIQLASYRMIASSVQVSPPTPYAAPAPKAAIASQPSPTPVEPGVFAMFSDMFNGNNQSPNNISATGLPTANTFPNATATYAVKATSTNTTTTTKNDPVRMPADIERSINRIISNGLLIQRKNLVDGRRPKVISIMPKCKREYDFRFFDFSKLTDLQYYGYGPKGVPPNTKIIPLASKPDDIDNFIKAGSMQYVNLTLLERPDLQMLDQCASMTFPQLIYLLSSKKFAFLDDSCISTINRSLFRALTPAFAEEIFTMKPGLLIRFWRFFSPEVKAMLPSIDKYVLRDPSKSFLCCSFHCGDFSHFNRLYSATKECLLNMLAPIKCLRIAPDFWSEGVFDNSNRTSIELSQLNLLAPLKELPQLPRLKSDFSIGSSADKKLLFAHILEQVSLECYDAMAVNTRIALWAKIQHLGIISGDIVVGRKLQAADDMAHYPDIAKKFGATTPIRKMADSSATSAESKVSVLFGILLAVALIFI